MSYPTIQFDRTNPDRAECFKMLCDLFGGEHHLNGIVRNCGATGIEVNMMTNGFASYDFSKMTMAVVLAHDRAIRIDVSPSSPRRLRLTLHKRQREGCMASRHPSLEEHTAQIRRYFEPQQADTAA